MKRLVALLLFTAVLVMPATASADWRWAPPHFKKAKISFYCDDLQCIKRAYLKARKHHIIKVKHYNQRRLKEWRHWTAMYIPDCTWYGESGFGAEFDPARYTMPNSEGSGALGKYQMMSATYHDDAKYHDWSPLDQEIAGHIEYAKHGTSPWTNC
jgi:hypothetical protein